MTRKITYRFILYFLGFYVCIFLLILGFLLYSLFTTFADLSIYGDIREFEDDTIQLYMNKNEDSYTFSQELIDFVNKKQASLQIINSDGEVTLSSNDEALLPQQYTYTDLVHTLDEPSQFTWVLDNGDLLLYTEHSTSDFLLEELQKSAQFPTLTKEDKTLLKKYDAVFDIYDQQGKLVYTTDSTKQLEGEDIIRDNQNSLFSDVVKAYLPLDNGDFVMIRTPNEHYKAWDKVNLGIGVSILKILVVFHLVLFILIIIFSLLIGRNFGRPILYFLRKIQRLAENDYTNQDDDKANMMNNGKIKRKYKIFEDVNHSLTTLTNNLQSNEQQIAHTEKLRDDWITGLSHDLKTPLSTVLGYSAMLGSNHDWSNEERRHFARTIEEKALYMDELIDDLTYTYQLKNKGIKLDLTRTNISHFIEACLESDSYRYVTLIDKDVPVYACLDTKRFHRVLDNLLVNALTHNAAGTKVKIYICEKDGQAIIQIKDNGQGMSPETVTHLFNRYYRGTNTTSENTGTGLGLTIAKQLVEAHDGSIHVTSNENGTTVTITLPSI